MPHTEASTAELPSSAWHHLRAYTGPRLVYLAITDAEASPPSSTQPPRFPPFWRSRPPKWSSPPLCNATRLGHSRNPKVDFQPSSTTWMSLWARPDSGVVLALVLVRRGIRSNFPPKPARRHFAVLTRPAHPAHPLPYVRQHGSGATTLHAAHVPRRLPAIVNRKHLPNRR